LNLIKKVGKDCKKSDIAFICEPFVYQLKHQKNFKNEFPKLVIETVGKISASDIDIVKVQFPGDVKTSSEIALKKNCEELDSVCKKPWVLLSGGTKYYEFSRQVEIASRYNASGIMVGRALWQEAFEKNSLQEIINFVKTESVARLNKLSSIARNGLSWFDRINASK
jgi:tagatose-1,6-bisphosphate aldolase